MSQSSVAKFIRNSPRISKFNVVDLPGAVLPKYDGLSRKRQGRGHRGQSQFGAYQPLGKLIGKTPFYLTVPKEPYNSFAKRHYLRISLTELQRLIDMKRVDINSPIDLTSICNTGLFTMDSLVDRNYGIHLTSEGADLFTSPVNIEVQYASESVIAAVERMGGVITTRFYDLFSIYAKSDPKKFFQAGYPIPEAKLPPADALEYYCGAENRGYLADRLEIAKARVWLSQKYGYQPPDLSTSPIKQMLMLRKHERQIFHNLQPGWLVNLVDGTVIKPT
ncbi:YmL15 [Cichlidogyrus casuarinus]|uniref:Large ribosomal subunit protein uL15m n=1 Tax=Cichlidogyrus casuarinus TaxID=1844966 RepID=A0ABD2QIF6_9PLAT